MNHCFKLIFTTAVCTLAVNSSFSQRDKHTIELRLNAAGEIMEPEMPSVRRHDTVSWVIRDPNIAKFSIKRKGNRHIFTTTPEREQGTSLTLVVAYGIKLLGGKWEYAIDWTDAARRPRSYDPKIAVRPVLNFAESLLLVGFIVTLITTIIFFRRWQAAKRSLEVIRLQK